MYECVGGNVVIVGVPSGKCRRSFKDRGLHNGVQCIPIWYLWIKISMSAL